MQAGKSNHWLRASFRNKFSFLRKDATSKEYLRSRRTSPVGNGGRIKDTRDGNPRLPSSSERRGRVRPQMKRRPDFGGTTYLVSSSGKLAASYLGLGANSGSNTAYWHTKNVPSLYVYTGCAYGI